MRHSSRKHGAELQTQGTAPNAKALREAPSAAARKGWPSLTAPPCPLPSFCSQFRLHLVVLNRPLSMPPPPFFLTSPAESPGTETGELWGPSSRCSLYRTPGEAQRGKQSTPRLPRREVGQAAAPQPGLGTIPWLTQIWGQAGPSLNEILVFHPPWVKSPLPNPGVKKRPTPTFPLPYFLLPSPHSGISRYGPSSSS